LQLKLRTSKKALRIRR